MRRIWTMAAACGLVAFSWSLARPPGAQSAARAPFVHDIPGLTRWLTENPSDLRQWFDLAQMCEESGDETGASRAWSVVLHDAPIEAEHDGRYWFMTAWAADRLGDVSASEAWRQAAAYYEGRLRDSTAGGDPWPTHQWRYWDRLGWCRARTGNAAGAREAWGRAAELLKGPPDWRRDGDSAVDLAREMALSGLAGEALSVLEAAEPSLSAAAVLRDPRLASLRHARRFDDLIGRLVMREWARKTSLRRP